MNIDVVNVLWLQTCVAERCFHNELCTKTLWMGCCDVESVSTFTVAYHLSIDFRSTCLGMLEFLKDETTSALSHYKSVAACAERT